MAKYPISITDSIHDGKMSQSFLDLLRVHVKDDAKILDPTAGGKLLWADMEADELGLGIHPNYEITFSDIGYDDGINLRRARTDKPEWLDAFDAVVYDPPYLIGENETDDPRERNYGSYAYSTADLEMYMDITHSVIPDLLKPNGKLILKCSDQYVVPERKFYPHHYDWMTHMMNQFEIVDIMIYRHHRMSPTAFQVKDRPCSVVMHTYYIVGVKA